MGVGGEREGREAGEWEGGARKQVQLEEKREEGEEGGQEKLNKDVARGEEEGEWGERRGRVAQ